MTITKENYVGQAENVMKELNENSGKAGLTTSKIRKILGMVSDLYNEAKFKQNKLDRDMVSKIQYLKLHIVYEAGRDNKTVKPFVEKAKLIENIDGVGDSKENLMLFCHYMEALVAYHRYFGGRDS